MQRKIPTTAATALALSVLAPWPAVRADEVRLKDGTVIKGIINSVENGTLSITPGYNAEDPSKSFKFKIEDIQTFTTEEPLFVGTAAEDKQTFDNVAHGKVEATTNGIRVLTSTGTTLAPVSQVKAVWRTPKDSPQARQLQKLEHQWDAEVFTDLRGKSGNSDQIGASVGFTATNTGPGDTLKFYGRYNYYRTDGNQSADDLVVGADYDSRFTEQFLWFVRTNNGYNKINLMDFYSETAAGGGVMLLNEKDHKLELRVGMGYRHETRANDTYLDKPSLYAESKYQIAWEWGRFEDRLNCMPVLDEFGNFILKHEAYLEFPIAKTSNWKIRMGVSNEYNSRPLPGVKSLDTTYFTRIVFSFK